MEIASHARAFAVTSLRESQPVLTAMTAISILAMASVIYLFGGYVDSPNEQRTAQQYGSSARTFNHKVEVTKRRS